MVRAPRNTSPTFPFPKLTGTYILHISPFISNQKTSGEHTRERERERERHTHTHTQREGQGQGQGQKETETQRVQKCLRARGRQYFVFLSIQKVTKFFTKDVKNIIC